MADEGKLMSPLQCSFTVGPRYTDLKPLGFGGNGLVCSAADSECDKHVAIKKISFSDRRSCRQALREIKIIRRLQHENIVRLYEILSANGNSVDLCNVPNLNEFRTVYLIQELLDTDLHRVIQSQTVSGPHIRLFMYQLFRGLKYIHSANVLHRDLKPSNLLINFEDLVLKIGDFGLARIIDPMYCHKGYLSENVSTRWYRSPELIITPNNYTKAIDMWSCGCILAEMLQGKPIFPGANEAEQISLILEAVPVPQDDIDKVFDLVPKNLLKNYHGQPKNPLRERFPNIDKDALNLLECLLTFDPRDRITAEEALMHPYLHTYSYPPDEPITDEPFCIESEVDDLSLATLKKIIFTESSNVQWQNNAVGIDNLGGMLDDLSIKENNESDDDLMNRSFTELDSLSLKELQDENMTSPNKLQEEFDRKMNEEEENMAFEKKLALDYESECSEKSDEDVKEDGIISENKIDKESHKLEEKLQMEEVEKEKFVEEGDTVVEKKEKCKLNVACSVKLKDNSDGEDRSEKEDSDDESKINIEEQEKFSIVHLKTDSEKEGKQNAEKGSSETSGVQKSRKEVVSVKRKINANSNYSNIQDDHYEREKTLENCLEIDRYLALNEDNGVALDVNLPDVKKKIRSRHISNDNYKHGSDDNAEGYTSPKLQHKMNEILKHEQERNNAVRLSLLGKQKGLEEYKQQLHIDLPIRDMERTSGPNSPRSPKMYSPRGEKSVRPKKYNSKTKGKQ
ncbi:uncharacterized protein LOC144443179 [Glandiceps talaboti]